MARTYDRFRLVKVVYPQCDFASFLLYQRLRESVEPILYLAGPDPCRSDGYDFLLLGWSRDLIRYRGRRLVQALQRTTRRFLRRGLDPIVISGLLYQVCKTLETHADGVSGNGKRPQKAN